MTQHGETAVVVNNVYKTFRLPHEQHNGVKQLALNVFKKPSKRKRGFETQHVLKDISFEIKKGEFFGIVGRNGSGKSTLLKLLAGIYTADKGVIAVNGSLTPFIELGVGFNPELTGRENVYLNGALLGFSKEDMESMYDDIVSFAELEKFMDQKLKNYSSGMQVRLAFSIAIRAKSDILLIDEVLAVGDTAFQQKCFNYFDELKRNKKTIVLVTHDMSAVTRFCDRALLMENGTIKAIGSPRKIANQYAVDNFIPTEETHVKEESSQLQNGVSKLDVKIRKKEFHNGENLSMEIHYKLDVEQNVAIGMSIIYENISIIEEATHTLSIPLSPHKTHILKLSLPIDKLNAGRYRVDVAVLTKDLRLVAFNTNAAQFMITTEERQGGLLLVDGKWSIDG